MERNLVFAFACALRLSMWPLCGATPQEQGFVDTLFENGLETPTSLAWAPDGSNRLFVTLKERGVRVVQNGILEATPFVTFPQLHTGGECGVLGLCFDPDYLENHYVYVFVTVSASEQRIIRFTDVRGVGVARTTIISGLPTLGGIHNGGAIGFGHDGKLYWAIGDNGDKRGVDAELRTLAAKVGRANPDGSIPNNNPFRDGTGPRNDFIWATGFRNPFTMTFQPRTGKMWLNVVGSDRGGQTVPNSGPGYEQVFALSAGQDGGYDDYEGNQPQGSRYNAPFVRPLVQPVIQYKTERSVDPAQSRNISRIGFDGSLMVNTTEPHPYRAGQAVIISGTTTFDGTFVVQRVTSPTQFVLPDLGQHTARIEGGTVRPLVQGTCIGGGCFYESSAFPKAYRGNFFYCDYAAGRIMRAQIDAENRVVSVRYFATDARSPVDLTTGPDGALFYAEIGTGSIRRVEWRGETSDLVVAPAIFNIREGGAGSVSVRLGSMPTSDVTVTVRRMAGDPDLDVESGSSLVFGAKDWNKPQTVTIRAAPDNDTDRDEATFSVSAPGRLPEMVRVSGTDTTDHAPLLSTTSLEMEEGKTAAFQVSLSSPPRRATTLSVRRMSGNSRVRVVKGARLIFTPENYAMPQTVSVVADEDANGRTDSARLVVRARGYDPRRVNVAVIDNDPSGPAFTSAPKTAAVVGLSYSYQPTSIGLPAPTFALVTGPAAMTIDTTTGALAWIPPETGSFPVLIRADNGRAPAAEQGFILSVETDQPPAVFITLPEDGSTVSGAQAEFFGSGSDDYGCSKCEFRIDGVLVYTDETRENHFHMSGAHNRWDTTLLSNGAHTLQMTAFDDKNQAGTAEAEVTVAN